MKDERTREQLLKELEKLRIRIKELEDTEIALQICSKRTQAVFNAVPDLMFQIDKDGVFKNYKTAKEELYIPPEEFMRKSIHDIFPKELAKETMHFVERTIESGDMQIFEYQLQFEENLHYYEARMVISGENEVLAIIRDITEHKCTEGALQENEEKYRAIFERAADSIVLIDAETGGFAEFNDKAHKSLGYTREEFKELKIPDFGVIESLEEFMKHIAKIIEQGTDIFESKHRTKSGKIRTIMVSASAVSIGGKKFIQSIWRDITEHKRAENALRESEEKYRNMVERANDGITIIQDTIIRYANPRLAEIVGHTVEELIGTPFMDYIHPDELPKVVDRYKRRMAGEAVTSIYETALVHKKGHRIETEFNAGLISYDGGTADFVFIRDITKRKNAEKALRESEERYRLLFDIAPIGITLHDGEKFLITNKKGTEILGFGNPAQIVGLPVRDIVTPESVEIVDKRINAMFAQEPQEPIQMVILKQNDERIIVDIVSAPIKYGGRDVILSALRDVTERVRAQEEKKALEEKLLQAQKLEAIGRLAGGIAHEFNNLLNGIIGYSELIKENLSVSDPAFRYTELIFKAGIDASRLTRQILSFARRSPIEKHPFSVDDAVTEVVEILDKTAPRNIMFETDFSGEAPFAIGDMAQIEQVIMNLCVNAIDAMPEGGELNLATDLVIADFNGYPELRAGKYARLIITDTGTGMDDELIQRIFDPFFTTKGPTKGTGLGLSIAFSIIHEHDGHIGVESIPGIGSTFEILLPYSVERTETGTVYAMPEASAGQETILIADDEVVVLNLLIDLLQSRGYSVFPTVNGEEAVELFKTKQDEIDLVLLDVVMPKMDGVTALTRILEIAPDTKILMLSGYTQIDTIESCLAAGAQGFIRKPFRIGELSEKIWDVLNS